jgi:hypothetical protein
MISSSLDWVSHEMAMKLLYQKHVPPRFHDDAFRLIKNIGKMVTTLSNLEVKQRNAPCSSINRDIRQLVDRINYEIDMIEQNATILMLGG